MTPLLYCALLLSEYKMSTFLATYVAGKRSSKPPAVAVGVPP